MTLKNRIELRARFMNGLRPSEEDFSDVIGSTLNKRDDQFFGKWRPGVVYRKGDVVIHERTLWVFKADEDLCSNAPPELGDDWQSLIVPVGDEDWFVLEDPDDPDAAPVLMVANDRVDGVGIGTFAPKAVLDVLDAGASRFLLGPKAAPCAALTLVNLKGDAEKTYLFTGLDADYVSWMSDVPGGFAFRHGDPCDEGDEDRLGCRQGTPLMLIQPDTGGLVRVGIGTERPAGMLDVTDRRKGQFVFNPEDKEDPAFTIVNLDPEAAQHYLASGVGPEKAVLVTDAPEGFVFKQGGAYGAFCNEENINQGTTLASITPDGKVGVGMEPEDYHLDVNGLIRAYVLYLNTDRGRMARPAALGDVLEAVMRLRPVRFTWLKATGFMDEGEQIGLIAQEVEEVFPQVVKTNRDETKAVAYPNLVAVVIKAVQEQQAVIEGQQAQLDAQQQQIEEQQAVDEQQQEQIDEQQTVNEAQQQQLDAQQQQIEEQQAVNEAQQAQIDALQERLADQQQRLDDQEAVNSAQDERLADHEARLEKLEQAGEPPDLGELRRQLEEQQALNERQQQQLEEQQRVIDRQTEQIAEILRIIRDGDGGPPPRG